MTYQQFLDNFDRINEYSPAILLCCLAYTFLCLFLFISDYNLGDRSLLHLHKRTDNKKFLIVNHVVSLLFCLQFVTFTLTYHNPMSYIYGMDEASNNTFKTTEMDRLNFAILSGYFIYDTVALFIHILFIEGSRFDLMTLFHHFFAVTACIYAITQDSDGYFMVQGIICLESSNPFYQIYRILQHTKWDLGWIETANSILFITAYTVLRMGCGLHLCWYTWYHNKAAYCQILGNAGAFISVWWFREIVEWVWKNSKMMRKQKKSC